MLRDRLTAKVRDGRANTSRPCALGTTPRARHLPPPQQDHRRTVEPGRRASSRRRRRPRDHNPRCGGHSATDGCRTARRRAGPPPGPLERDAPHGRDREGRHSAQRPGASVRRQNAFWQSLEIKTGHAPLQGRSARSQPALRWRGFRTTGPAEPSAAQIDDPVRRCQFSPPALVAALLDLESAGRIGALPDNCVASLTDEAH